LTPGRPVTNIHAIFEMEWEQYKPDISVSLAELDVDSSGESVFNIRPELSRQILSNDTWLSNIQPKTLRNSAGGR
jgi:hypothetical protein